MSDLPPAPSESTSLVWAVVVPAMGLLAWLVKALVDRIATGQDKLNESMQRVASGIEKIPEAVRDALREHTRV